MTPSVRLTNGVAVTLASGETVVLDGSASGDVTVLSHAHGDHLVRRRADPVVCSPLTAALAAVRNGGTDLPSTATHDYVSLQNAGHIAGSRAATITDPETGRRYCYTGDCCTRDRLYLDGYDPRPADVLVLETTYGTPEYRLPPNDELLPAIRDWLDDTMDSVVVLVGYALGRAQKLQRLAAQAGRRRVLVPDSVARLNAAVETHLDVTFDADRLADADEFRPGDALVVPARTRRRGRVASLLERDDSIVAGFSGWAIDESYRYRGDYDVTFPLSDHCDFDELVDVVRTVDPDRVYTHHGFAEEFAAHLTSEYGYETRALKKDQATLEEF